MFPISATKVNMKKLNRIATIQNILAQVNKGDYGMDEEKFNEKLEDEKFLIDSADFVGAEVVFEED